MKWMFTDLKKHFKKNGEDFDRLFEKICNIIAKAVIGVDERFVNATNRKPQHRINAFELFGVDIMIDEDLKPWLIEVSQFLSFFSLMSALR